MNNTESTERASLEDYFTELIKAYLYVPDDLQTEWTETRSHSMLAIQPNPYDVRTLTGNKGRTFNALKDIIQAIGKTRGWPIELVLLEDPEEKNNIRIRMAYYPNKGWEPKLIRPILVRTLQLSGKEHMRISFLKNKANTDGDETYYAFSGMQGTLDELYANALGQLIQAMGWAQGQRLVPKPSIAEVRTEKTA